MKSLAFSGSFYEMGVQQGAIYRKNRFLEGKIRIDEKLYNGQLKVYREHYPELFEEIEGIASEGNFDRKKLFYWFACSELLWFRKHIGNRRGCATYFFLFF